MMPVETVGGRGAKVERVEIRPLTFALPQPFRAAVRTIGSVDFVMVEVTTTDGAAGLGHAFCFGPDEAKALAGLIDLLGQRLVGRDPMQIEAVWRDLFASLVFLGQGGAGLSALGAIDIALWDLRGRLLGQPLWKLLGGARTAVPVYGSAGSLALETAALAAEAEGFAAAGWPAVKLKLGHGPRGDLARLEAVRRAVGPDIKVIADANQQYDRKAAVAAADLFRPVDLWWLEEPVPAADVEACAAVTAAAACPIATGETNGSIDDFRRLLALRGADVLMPNIQRVGGITPWRKIAAAAELADIPVASHVFPEINVHLMAGIANGLTLEVIPWWPCPFQRGLAIKDGLATPPDEPGHGLRLDPEIARRAAA